MRLLAMTMCAVLACMPVAAKEFGKAGEKATPPAVVWPVPWRVGLKLEYAQTNETVKIRQGVETQGSSSAVTTIEIVAAPADGFLQRWRWRDVGNSGGKPPSPTDPSLAQREAVLRGLQGLPLDVRLDADGAYVSIANIDEIARLTRSTVQRMADAGMAGKPLSTQDRAALDRVFDSMTEPATLEALIAAIPSRYNWMAGGGLVPGKEYRFEDEGPNPFGSEPFPTSNMLLLEADPQQPGWYLVQWTMSIDKAKGGELLATVITNMLGDLVQKLPPAERDKLIETVERDTVMNFSARFRIDGGTGLVQWMQLVQEKRVGQVNQIETTTLELRGVASQAGAPVADR